MLRLADAWTWDFWLADDGRSYHLYFLKAPRHIGHPDERHWNVSIGHAVSPDLADWTVVPDAIAPAGSELSDQRRQAGTGGGIWCLPCTSPLGPFNLTQAVRITDESLYSGRLVRDRAGRWVMLAFPLILDRTARKVPRWHR
jgi:hypothetical protein